MTNCANRSPLGRVRSGERSHIFWPLNTSGWKPCSETLHLRIHASPESRRDRQQILDLSKWPEFNGYGPLPGIREADFETKTDEIVGTKIRVTNRDGSTHVEEILCRSGSVTTLSLFPTPTGNHRRTTQRRQQHQHPQPPGEEIVVGQQLLPRNSRYEVEEPELEASSGRMTENRTVENIGQLFSLAKELDIPLFVSPH